MEKEVRTENKQTTENTPVNKVMTVVEKQALKDKGIIESYLAEKGLKAQSTASGLYYIIDKEGTEDIASNATVEVHYEGTLLDGRKFDSSYDRGQTISFPLSRVIPGWTEGIPLFKKGGAGTLIIPSGLGYGARGAGGSIPPNAVLLFKVEVFNVL